MTIDISNNDPRISYSVAQGVTQTSFAIPFEFFDDSDVNVYVDGALKTITTDYTISGGGGSTGTVSISVTGATGGSVVVLTRDVTIERTTDFTAGADINRAALNTQLDTLTAIAADVRDQALRGLRVSDLEIAPSLVIPSINDRKNKTLVFNASTGAPEAGPTVDEVSNAQTYANNSATSAAASAASASAAAGSASAAAASASAAASSESHAASSESAAQAAQAAAEAAQAAAETAETNAETAETNAASSASAASTSASNATSSASAASTSASNAATSETNASNSATAAASSASAASASQVAAAASAAAAAASYDTFDDRYLGTKTSDPTLDNDGNALVAGALYFNSVANEMRVYDGANWIPASSAGGVSLLNYNYTATAGQTTFSGADDNAANLSYTQQNLIVTLNGIVLEDGTDYTASNGTSIVLSTGAAAGDELNVVAFKSFTTADMVPASTGGTFSGNVVVYNNTADTNAVLKVEAAGSGNSDADIELHSSATNSGRIRFYDTVGEGGRIEYFHDDDVMTFDVNGSERMRITSAGDVGIGTTSPAYDLDVRGTGDTTIQVKANSSGAGADDDASLVLDAAEAGEAGVIFRNGGVSKARIEWFNAGPDLNIQTESGTNGNIDFQPNENLAMRIDSSGNVLVGTTNTAPATNNVAGYALSTTAEFSRSGGTVVGINRLQDGSLVAFRSAGTSEGNISVSGTTVSYNGGHLSRWSQTADNTRIELLKGTVLTNLDQMAVWGDEENEQLNCMAVSSVEGDPNVAGVFVNWDNDDDEYTNDMNVAMTGDMIIRIGAGVTVQRGDLLMSAGDGTAKPQGDDIIRSKTIAKVTSTHVTCTYEDGSYCVPCVLMAC